MADLRSGDIRLSIGPAPRILVLRQGGVGDALVAVPIVRALRRRLPGAVINVLLSRRNLVIEPAFRAYASAILEFTRRPLSTAALVYRLRRSRYDVVIDLVDKRSTTSDWLLDVTGAPVRLGVAQERPGSFTHLVPRLETPGTHIVDRLAAMLRPFGIDPEREALDLEYPIDEVDRTWARQRLGRTAATLRVGINLSGSGPSKYWGRERFVAFVRTVLAERRGGEVLLFSSAQYAAEARAIAAESGARAVPPEPEFHRFAALLNECDVLVTPDTSVSHLAAAWKRPALVFFIQPPGGELLWAPYRSPYRAVCTPVRVGDIPVAQALDAFRSLLAAEHPVPLGVGA